MLHIQHIQHIAVGKQRYTAPILPIAIGNDIAAAAGGQHRNIHVAGANLLAVDVNRNDSAVAYRADEVALVGLRQQGCAERAAFNLIGALHHFQLHTVHAGLQTNADVSGLRLSRPQQRQQQGQRPQAFCSC